MLKFQTLLLYPITDTGIWRDNQNNLLRGDSAVTWKERLLNFSLQIKKPVDLNIFIG